jgi:hypothetical protein
MEETKKQQKDKGKEGKKKRRQKHIFTVYSVL